jgi:hypothetical protein
MEGGLLLPGVIRRGMWMEERGSILGHLICQYGIGEGEVVLTCCTGDIVETCHLRIEEQDNEIDWVEKTKPENDSDECLVVNILPLLY